MFEFFKVNFAETIQFLNGVREILFKICCYNTEFLVAIIAYETAMIAFLVPLSVEIVSKLSERYSSGVIISAYENGFVNRIFPSVIIFIICVSMLLILSNGQYQMLWWKHIFIATIVLFLISLLLTFAIMRRMAKFMKDSEMIVKFLAERARNAVK